MFMVVDRLYLAGVPSSATIATSNSGLMNWETWQAPTLSRTAPTHGFIR